MQNTLIDAGPIIALFNKNDKYYKKITEFLKKYRGELISTWPVITEVMEKSSRIHIPLENNFHIGAESSFPILMENKIHTPTENKIPIPLDGFDLLTL